MKRQTAHAQSAQTRSETLIKCGYCGNTFSAPPRRAVCPKCRRSAHKPLALPLRLLCLLLFPAGVLTAILVRPARPYAASQALLFSACGALVWAALYFLLFQN